MAKTYYFLEEPTPFSAPLHWFRQLEQTPIEITREDEVVLYFRHFGRLEEGEDGVVDGSRSPVVILDLPKVRHGVLWTAGKVHFLTRRKAAAGPAMASVRKRFQQWLYTFTQVFGSSTPPEVDSGYYLEGSNWGYADKVFAFRSALAALQREQYFVNSEDSEQVLEGVCRKLRLRGVDCR